MAMQCISSAPAWYEASEYKGTFIWESTSKLHLLCLLPLMQANHLSHFMLSVGEADMDVSNHDVKYRVVELIVMLNSLRLL